MSVLQFKRKVSPLPAKIEALARQEASLDWMPDEWGVDEHGFYAASDADWDAMEAHFARYGFRINRHAPLDSYQAGLRFLSGLLSKVGYFREYPDHYRLFTKDWSETEHAYLRAVADGDIEKVFELVSGTRFPGEIGRTMRMPEGCGMMV